MKVILNILITVGVAFCEVPPPYPSRGFRPSPPFVPILPTQFSSNQVREPQRTYGVPSTTPPKVNFPPAPQTTYGVPNNPNLTPNLSSKQTIPGTSYGVPIRSNGGSLRNNIRIVNRPLQNQPQTQYGVPNTRNIETLEQIRQLNSLLESIQNSQSNKGNQFSSALSQALPQRGPTDFNSLQSQNSNQNSNQPSVQYLPSREIAHFQLTQSSNQNVQSSNQNIQHFSQPQQFLPVKDATNFRQGFQLPEPGLPQVPIINPSIPNSNIDLPSRQEQNRATSQNQPPQSPNNQYVPSDPPTRPNSFGGNNNQQTSLNFDQRQPNTNANNFGQNNPQNNFDIQPADVRKLEPGNDNRNVNGFRTPAQNLGLTRRPIEQNRDFGEKSQATGEKPDKTYLVPSTTLRSVNRQLNRPNIASTTTEAPVDDESTETEEAAVGPNIALATAVSGSPGGQGFYLLQPDGRLQRVVYQKIRDVGDQENEYTANYLFQNIQQDPNVVYSPLITLGK